MILDRRSLIGAAGAFLGSPAVASAWPTREEDGLPAKIGSLIRQIHGARQMASPGDSPFFIAHYRPYYVQAITVPEGDKIQIEVVSAQCVPAVAEMLDSRAERLLEDLGFNAPAEESPNYWQVLDVGSPERILLAASIAAAVLREVFLVPASKEISTELSLPSGAREAGFG